MSHKSSVNRLLCQAASQGKLWLAAQALNNGASPNALSAQTWQAGEEGRSALMLAAASGGADVVEELLRRGANARWATAKGSVGMGSRPAKTTALMCAAQVGQAQCVRALIPVSDAGALNAEGRDALWLCFHAMGSTSGRWAGAATDDSFCEAFEALFEAGDKDQFLARPRVAKALESWRGRQKNEALRSRFGRAISLIEAWEIAKAARSPGSGGGSKSRL